MESAIKVLGCFLITFYGLYLFNKMTTHIKHFFMPAYIILLNVHVKKLCFPKQKLKLNLSYKVIMIHFFFMYPEHLFDN